MLGFDLRFGRINRLEAVNSVKSYFIPGRKNPRAEPVLRIKYN